MIIIGITGTLGSGKGTVVEYLVSKGFKHYSARAFIEEEVRRRGLPATRDSTASVGNDLRVSHGAQYIAVELYKRAREEGANAVIESLRAPAEVEYLRAEGQGDFLLWAADAPPEKRYQWIRGRGSHTDNVTFEKFLADEAREMHSDDPTKQNIAACIKMADTVFINDGSKEDLWRKVGAALEDFRHKLASVSS